MCDLVDALVRRVKKFTTLLDKRTTYLAKISENCTEQDLTQWDDLRKEIEDKRSLPMPAAERRPDVQDERGPRFVDGRLDTVEEGLCIIFLSLNIYADCENFSSTQLRCHGSTAPRRRGRRGRRR